MLFGMWNPVHGESTIRDILHDQHQENIVNRYKKKYELATPATTFLP